MKTGINFILRDIRTWTSRKC